MFLQHLLSTSARECARPPASVVEITLNDALRAAARPFPAEATRGSACWSPAMRRPFDPAPPLVSVVARSGPAGFGGARARWDFSAERRALVSSSVDGRRVYLEMHWPLPAGPRGSSAVCPLCDQGWGRVETHAASAWRWPQAQAATRPPTGPARTARPKWRAGWQQRPASELAEPVRLSSPRHGGAPQRRSRPRRCRIGSPSWLPSLVARLPVIPPSVETPLLFFARS